MILYNYFIQNKKGITKLINNNEQLNNKTNSRSIIPKITFSTEVNDIDIYTLISFLISMFPKFTYYCSLFFIF